MSSEHPGAEADDRSDQAVDSLAPGFPGVRQTVILVADDDAIFRALVTALMQRDGYRVLSVADGHEGLEVSRKYPGPIDLVITDVQMPRLKGPDLCAHLFEERPGIRALVMSAAGSSEIVAVEASLPFLPKPFDNCILRARVRAILADSIPHPTH